MKLVKNTIRKLFTVFGYKIEKISPSERIRASGDLQKLFSHIYENNMWGGKKGDFFSGAGSLNDVTEQYIKVVSDFVERNKIKTIIDLGCGDFLVGARLVSGDTDYIGVDIVPSLIERNNRLFKSQNIQFKCLNVVTDQLPDGELCLIRQVLQHLGNAEIAKVLKQCEKYKYVIVSEHLPKNNLSLPNVDMEANWDIRLSVNSGVFIDKAPFQLYL